MTKDPGKKTTCTVTDKGTGQKFDMVVVVKDDRGGIDMNIPKLPVIAAPKIASLAAGALAPQIGGRPQVECPDDLALLVGQKTTCTLTDGTGARFAMDASVETPDGQMHFKIVRKLS